MIQVLEDKALQLFLYGMRALERGMRREEGQTATEYVAVTVVGVILAIGILYTVLHAAINNVVTNIANKLQNFISTAS